MKNYQNILFPYAYNILGSSEDAKDAIQEVVLKYTAINKKPENEKNYLIKGVINQSINLKRQKAKMQTRENWLPEPVFTEPSDLGIELRELVSYSLLILLERLSPKERAVFILKEAFAYTHEEIAEVLSVSIENSRKILSRAKLRLKVKPDKSPDKYKVSKQVNFEKLEEFITAIRERDLDNLHGLLSKEINFYADGGEKVRVVKEHCAGKLDVAGLLIHIFHKYQSKHDVETGIVNHQPALLYYYRGKLSACQVFEFDENQLCIKSINVIVDPLKLNSLQSK